MFEAAAQQIAEELQWPIEKAREFMAGEARKKWESHVTVYNYLKSKKPDIVKLEIDRENRIRQLMIEADVPRDTAAAIAVVSDLRADRELRRLRKNRKNLESKLRDLIGLTESVPDEIIKLLTDADT